jgi:hypothetical protein
MYDLTFQTAPKIAGEHMDDWAVEQMKAMCLWEDMVTSQAAKTLTDEALETAIRKIPDPISAAREDAA